MKQVSVELMNGEVVNGLLVHCDATMNMKIKDCIRTHSSGEVFWKGREAFIRAASVKSVQMDDRALAPQPRREAGRGRGESRGRGDGRGGRDGRGRGRGGELRGGRGRGGELRGGRGRVAAVGEKRRRDDTADS
jgi:U6 snRNA-associated Sm-like protein LSm4